MSSATPLTYRLARSLLFRLEPERAHRLTLRILRTGLLRGPRGSDDPILATRVWGRDFANPIGLAAGYDKNGLAIDSVERSLNHVAPGIMLAD